MPNEILFVGGRRETITILSGSVTETTNTSRFNTTYSDCALEASTATSKFKVDLYTETSNALSKTTVSGIGSKIFVHFVQHFQSGAGGTASNGFFELVDTDDYPWFSIRAQGSVSSVLFNIYYNSGTGPSPVWTEIGLAQNISTNTLETWDVEFTFGATHSVNVYRNGSIWRSGTFVQTSFTNVASVVFSRTSSSTGFPTHSISQIIVTDNISTIGAFVKTSRATGIGANAGFSGDHTAVNEVVANDSTIQTASTAGLRTTHIMSDVVVPTGLEIRSVFHWLRAKNDGTSPNNIRSVLRSGGIDYVTPNISLIGVGYAPVGARYNVDPLGTNWTEAEWNGIEAGYESAT